MLWTVFVAVVAVGAAYFLLFQRTKPSHVEAPEGELFAMDTAPDRAAAAL
ncbi:MAG: hypothetical protein M3P15_03435 [Actinomycetota bacterium]|nr:hypothetical protein [Actinomycetota bacterium]